MFERIYVEEAKGRNGERATVAGWVTRTRILSSISFIILRDMTGDIQVTVKDDGLREVVAGLGREDVISVTGEAASSEIAHAGFEFFPESIDVLNKAEQPLPFDLFGMVKAELDTRLDYRFMDFRTPRTSAIFRIQNELLIAFRRFLTDRGYLEIQPPGIIASASEGGADLFSLPYFEKEAFLAQSPQLYKQMCAISFEKVYTVVPVWRAEKFNTPTHINEVRQMDIEQAFADDETVMEVLEQCLAYMLGAVKERCPKELEVLDRQISVPELPLRRLTYTEAIDMLQGAGEEIVWGEDFSKAQERRLAELVGNEAFYIKDWPSVQKAFYAMPYTYLDILPSDLRNTISNNVKNYLYNYKIRNLTNYIIKNTINIIIESLLYKDWSQLNNENKLILMNKINNLLYKHNNSGLLVQNIEILSKDIIEIYDNFILNLNASTQNKIKFITEIVHAFDLLYGGVEICSGTQRIHLPDLLREQLRKKGLDPADFAYYIESFSYGAPPHAGWSIGLERLTMTVTGMSNIRECTMFPRDRDRLVP
jgi:aspartyl/asparaginyl-tRNA synthetase